jgi:hypothetical protein
LKRQLIKVAIHQSDNSSYAQTHLIYKTVSGIFLGLLDQKFNINDLVRVSRSEMAKILDP